MDTLRGTDGVGDEDGFDSGAIEAPPAIGSDERRMHVRAYNYWVSLLGSRALPSIEDLNPEELGDFSPNSVLLDFSMGMEDPAIIFLGSALREECGVEGKIERASDVPGRTLLSRLTDHYLQIIANAAPVGFEAEFTNQRGVEIMYRGILMPFSSDDETIDFIYGVINWKEVATAGMVEQLDAEIAEAMRTGPRDSAAAPIWADGPSATADFVEDDFGFDTVDEDKDELLDYLDDEPAEPVQPAIARGDAGDDWSHEAEALSVAGPADDEAETAEADDHGLLDLTDIASEELAAEEDEEASAEADTLDLGSFALAGEATAHLADEIAPGDGDAADEDDQPPSYSIEQFAVRYSFPREADVREEPLTLTQADTAPAGDFPSETELANDDDILELTAASHDDAEGDTIDATPGDFSTGLAPSAFEPTASVGALSDALDVARRSASEARDTDARSRSALYRAIGDAYDFALTARAAPDAFEMLLDQAGIARPERSPTTALVKLVFGADYDKTRIAEYALVIDHAMAQEMPRGSVAAWLSGLDGGLKGLINSVRFARKGGEEPRPAQRLERAYRRLAKATRIEGADLKFDEHGVALVVARREPDGSVSFVASIDTQDRSAQQALIAASKAI